MEYRGLAPLASGWWGVGALGKASPNRAGAQFGAFPFDRSGRSRGYRIGGYAPPVAHNCRGHGTGPPFPRPGLFASGWRFGRYPL